jgi:hypothetical protein
MSHSQLGGAIAPSEAKGSRSFHRDVLRGRQPSGTPILAPHLSAGEERR